MHQEINQITGNGAPARAVAASGWGANYTLSIVNDHIHLSAQCGAETATDRAKHGWGGPRVGVPDSNVLPIHIGATLLCSTADAHLRYVASDALLAYAEAAGGAAGAPSQRRWRSREARLLGEALATADRHRDEFLAVLSHELRSPLAAIRNAVHIVCNPTSEAQARHRAQALFERQLQRVTRLVDEMLDLSRLTLGRVPLNRERMDLRIAVNNAIETLETEIHERHHRLTVSLPDTPVWLRGDGRRLEQVFANLLANACKFTDTGGELAVRLHTSDGRAIVQVQDSGIGIEAHALPYIFDPFKQTDEGARRSEAGLGVGLALVREFVKLHGGSVMVRSAGRGQGSEFAVELPTVD